MATCTTKPNASTRGSTAVGTSSRAASTTSRNEDTTAVSASSHLRPVFSTSQAATTTPRSPTAAMAPVMMKARDCSYPASIRNVGSHCNAM